MNWSVYRLPSELPPAERRKIGIPPGAMTEELWAQLFAAANHQRSPQAAVLADTEYRWWRAGRPTWYLESEALGQWIWRLRLDVRLDEIETPRGAICLAPPDGLEIDGVHVRPALVARYRVGRAPDYRTHPDSPLRQVPQPVAEHHRLNVVFRGSSGYLSCSLATEDQLQAVIEHREYVPPPDTPIPASHHVWLSDAEALTDYDSRAISVHVRLAVAVLLYARAFPRCIRPGFPRGFDAREAHAARSQRQPTMVVQRDPRIRIVRGSPETHYRSGHLRTLRDPRYYRETGGVPPESGPRVVYVHPTIVRRAALDPHTVERPTRDEED